MISFHDPHDIPGAQVLVVGGDRAGAGQQGGGVGEGRWRPGMGWRGAEEVA